MIGSVIFLLHYSIRQKKINLELDVIYSNTANLDIRISRFVVLECITSSSMLVFYGMEGVFHVDSCGHRNMVKSTELGVVMHYVTRSFLIFLIKIYILSRFSLAYFLKLLNNVFCVEIFNIEVPLKYQINLFFKFVMIKI